MENCCLMCQFSSFPTERNGDLIENKVTNLCEGECSELNIVIVPDYYCKTNFIESDNLRIAEAINRNNNRIIEKIHKDSKTMYWNGRKFVTNG